MNDDRQLSELFERVKRADRAAAPGFDSMLRPRRRRHKVWVPAAAAALVAAALWLWPSQPPGSPVPLSEWQPPTAVLMQSPGDSFLREVPQVGGWDQEVYSCDDCF